MVKIKKRKQLNQMGCNIVTETGEQSQIPTRTTFVQIIHKCV